jgi:flagellin-like protein
MHRKDKRGISPVIATVLLITIALALAAIIFVWAKTFFAEKITKDGSDIEMSCDQVMITGEISTTTLRIENQGNIALYGVRIDKVEGGSVRELKTITPKVVIGGRSVDIPLSSQGVDLSEGDSVVVIPIILGENSKEERKEFACGSSTGLELEVSA